MQESDLPEITEDERPNPGWKIRVGVSRKVVSILQEASDQGIWFDTEEEIDEHIRRKLAVNAPDEDSD